jgi:hypothetical protein
MERSQILKVNKFLRELKLVSLNNKFIGKRGDGDGL